MRDKIGFTLVSVVICGMVVVALSLDINEVIPYFMGVGSSSLLLGIGYIWWRAEEIVDWINHDGEE